MSSGFPSTLPSLLWGYGTHQRQWVVLVVTNSISFVQGKKRKELDADFSVSLSVLLFSYSVGSTVTNSSSLSGVADALSHQYGCGVVSKSLLLKSGQPEETLPEEFQSVICKMEDFVLSHCILWPHERFLWETAASLSSPVVFVQVHYTNWDIPRWIRSCKKENYHFTYF